MEIRWAAKGRRLALQFQVHEVRERQSTYDSNGFGAIVKTILQEVVMLKVRCGTASFSKPGDSHAKALLDYE